MTTETSNNTDFVESLLAAHVSGGEKEVTETEEPEEVAETEEELPAETEAEPEEDGEEVEEEATDEAEAEPAPKMFRVKVDGEEIEVSEDELKRSYSGNAYIQKGMQKAAAAQKEAAALMQTLQSGYDLINQLTQQMQTEGYIQAPKHPDPALAQSDPVKFIREQATYQANLAKYNEQQAKLSQAQQIAARVEEARQAEILAEQGRVLSERIPEFSDPTKRAEISAKLVKVGQDVYGYSTEELGQIMDARAIQVLHDAMKWREVQASTAKAAKPTRPAMTVKPAAKPPANPVAKKQAALKSISKVQSTGDIVSALLKANSRNRG